MGGSRCRWSYYSDAFRPMPKRQPRVSLPGNCSNSPACDVRETAYPLAPIERGGARQVCGLYISCYPHFTRAVEAPLSSRLGDPVEAGVRGWGYNGNHAPTLPCGGGFDSPDAVRCVLAERPHPSPANAAPELAAALDESKTPGPTTRASSARLRRRKSVLTDRRASLSGGPRPYRWQRLTRTGAMPPTRLGATGFRAAISRRGRRGPCGGRSPPSDARRRGRSR
jgi:hypothetical protein